MSCTPGLTGHRQNRPDNGIYVDRVESLWAESIYHPFLVTAGQCEHGGHDQFGRAPTRIQAPASPSADPAGAGS
jgi:hypothetical protein